MKIKTSILTLMLAAFGFAFVVSDAGAVPANKFPGVPSQANRTEKAAKRVVTRCSVCKVAVGKCCHYASKVKTAKKSRPYWKKKFGFR